MAKIQYKIRVKESGKLATVFMRFSDKRGIDKTVPLPIKVNSDHWSNKTESFKQRIVFDQVFTDGEKLAVETDLEKLKLFVFKKFNELLQTSESFSKEWLILTIDRYYNKVTDENRPKETLNEYIARFVKEIKSGDRFYTHNNKTKRYETGSIKNFEGFKTQFDEYQKEKRVNLNFSDITIDFYDRYLHYFMKKNYSTNTIGRHIKNLKTIMRHAREEGLHDNSEIDRKKFKVLKEAVQNIYLTEKEVNLIENADLPEGSMLDKYRDVFLVGVYTAQRFSDFSRIKPENVRCLDNGLKVIDLTQKKTGERVIIPIKPELERILQKYNYTVPKTFEQKVNEKIKDIAKDLDINELVEIEQTKGGLKVKTTIPKHDLIKTHTARRTGCTLMYLAGIPTIDIMKMSGHRSERELLNYIKVGKEETAQNLAKHSYFMGNNLRIAK
jgi:integrase